MDDPEKLDVAGMAYLFVERTSPLEPAAFGRAMASAFREVWDHMQAAGVRAGGRAISVYPAFAREPLTFRAGFVVASEDAEKADEDVRADVTPAGPVLRGVHVGPRETLGESWKALMADVERRALIARPPCWELHADDPETTPPEARRTELYLPIA